MSSASASEPQRILITGGCGFVGSNLIAALRSRPDGTHIRAFDDESLGKRTHIAEFEVEFVHGDLRDVGAVRRAVAGMDAVVHLAADTRVMDSLADPVHNFGVNVVGSFNLLTAMRDAGVNRIISASTGGAIIGNAEPP
jgi:UDP-glucose 4-epimerase